MSDQPIVRDVIVRTARNFPELVASAKADDPALAAMLTEKSLVGSKSVWFPPISWLVTMAVTHYGVGWDADTSAMVSSMLAWVVVIIVRYISAGPIGSLLPKP